MEENERVYVKSIHEYGNTYTHMVVVDGRCKSVETMLSVARMWVEVWKNLSTSTPYPICMDWLEENQDRIGGVTPQEVIRYVDSFRSKREFTRYE